MTFGNVSHFLLHILTVKNYLRFFGDISYHVDRALKWLKASPRFKKLCAWVTCGSWIQLSYLQVNHFFESRCPKLEFPRWILPQLGHLQLNPFLGEIKQKGVPSLSFLIKIFIALVTCNKNPFFKSKHRKLGFPHWVLHEWSYLQNILEIKYPKLGYLH